MQNLVSNMTQHHPPPYTLYICLYTVYFTQGRGEGVGESWTREKVRGPQYTKLGRKYQNVYPIYKLDKHLQQSPFTGQLF